MNKVFFIVVLGLLLFSSCSSEEELEEIPLEFAYFTYVPIQCVNEPWENWFASSGLEFSKEPSDEEKLRLFLETEYSIEVYSLQKKIITEYICSRGCALCPEGHQYIVKVESVHSEQMLKLNWKKVLSIRS